MADTKKKTTKKSKTSSKSNVTKSAEKKKAPVKDIKSTSTKKTVNKTESPKKVSKSTSEKFAVIEINGNQLLVEENGKYEMFKIDGAKGDELKVSEVLLVVDGKDVKVGKPYVDGAVVSFVIDSQKKGDKVRTFKFKSKSRYRRTHGKREMITRILVTKIKS